MLRTGSQNSEPNNSVKPTRSGLRPPRAAYLKRSPSLREGLGCMDTCMQVVE